MTCPTDSFRLVSEGSRRVARGLLGLLTVAALVLAALPARAATLPKCAASPDWVTHPNPPQEIPGGGSDFCDFYQFGWQWFLYLVSPSGSHSGDRNYQVWENFPLLQAQGIDSCATKPKGMVLFVRLVKSDDPFEDFTIPESIGQAAGGATIYDQAGNVVYYAVNFSRNECTAPSSGDLPAGTTEIKTSWRILDPSQAAGYFTMKTVIEGVSKDPVLLGLVGFHLFRTTAQHPEGLWITWEHATNDPDCIRPQPMPASGWSFTSAKCAQCLAAHDPVTCMTTASCDFNTAEPAKKVTGTPSEICRVYRDGTGPRDHKAAENVVDVDELNRQLVGPDGFLTELPPDNPMAVFKNYFNVGGLWVSDPSMPADSSNQRGSLQLTNTTMETTVQGNFEDTGPDLVRTGALNCFGCHDYTPGKTATTGLSHIIDDIHGKTAAERQREKKLELERQKEQGSTREKPSGY